MTKTLRCAALATCVLVLAACGDPDTNDARGYTKAPLENPGWTIDGEEPGSMAALGDPIRIPAMDTLQVDTSDAATQSTTPAAGARPATPGAP